MTIGGDTMDYIVIGLLLFNSFLLLFLLLKKEKENNIGERLSTLEIHMIKELQEFKDKLKESLNHDFTQLNEQVERRLLAINEQVNNKVDQNFEKTNKTFTAVMERLGKIDEAQKKIDVLSGDIVSLQGILTDKKSRGIFGEVNLKHILVNVFGEKNDRIYRLQYPLPNKTIADSILFAPEPLGTIAIDSKFPLENYQKMVDKKASKEEQLYYTKQFKMDVKKHIDAIASKYIIKGVTSDQAILFLPAEAIFAELNAYHQDLIEYSYKKRVWITSPTTLISTLTVIEMIIKNMEKDKYASIIHEELNKLGLEFARYKERWDRLSRSIQTVNKEVENVSITTDKISKKFNTINQVEVDKLLEQKEDLSHEI